MQNLTQIGNRITWTNGTGTAVAAGDPVVVAGQIGVACVDIANGASGELAMEGVYELPKSAGSAITQGDPVMFDVSAAAFVPSSATPATGDITGCCIAWAAAASADTVVQVKINVAIGTVN